MRHVCKKEMNSNGLHYKKNFHRYTVYKALHVETKISSTYSSKSLVVYGHWAKLSLKF